MIVILFKDETKILTTEQVEINSQTIKIKDKVYNKNNIKQIYEQINKTNKINYFTN